MSPSELFSYVFAAVMGLGLAVGVLLFLYAIWFDG